MSHYFICYLSTFQMYLGVPKLAEPIVDFWHIEVPRSTKSVVRAWNRPMHKFLKMCKCSNIFSLRLSINPSSISCFPEDTTVARTICGRRCNLLYLRGVALVRDPSHGCSFGSVNSLSD